MITFFKTKNGISLNGRFALCQDDVLATTLLHSVATLSTKCVHAIHYNTSKSSRILTLISLYRWKSTPSTCIVTRLKRILCIIAIDRKNSNELLTTYITYCRRYEEVVKVEKDGRREYV